MSASIYWKPAKGGKRLDVALGSKFAAALGLPRTLTEKDCGFLDGLAAGEESFYLPVNELREAILEHGEVEVYAEY